MFDKKKEKKEPEEKAPAPQPESPKAMTVVNPEMSFVFILKSNPDHHEAKTFFNGETPIACYKTIRDHAIFTNKRIIIKDIQGITGTKVNTLVIPYTAIKMYSVESAGIIGLDADITLWTTVGQVHFHLNRGLDVDELCMIIAERIC